jgi:hypothetical protein
MNIVSFKNFRKVILIVFVSFIFPGTNAFSITDSLTNIGVITPTLDTTSKTGYYIPVDMMDCMKEMDKLFPNNVKDSIKLIPYIQCYNKYGYILQWMIDKWDMWDTSRIVRYFKEFGFDDPSVIANGLLKSYWNFLNNKPLRIEMIPKVYIINNNLFLKKSDSLSIPNYQPNPKGTITYSDGKPEFIFMGRPFHLIDSLYDPVLKLIGDNKFTPSDSLRYVWWTLVGKFGESVDTLPHFISKEEMETKFNKEDSYNADYIVILEDGNSNTLNNFIDDGKFDDEFKKYVESKRHISFYLIRKRKVHVFNK